MILELQNAILEMIAKGEPLAATIEQLCLRVEAAVPGITASVLTFDGSRLHTLAAPSLPPDYSAAVDNLEAGPLAGSCGAAAYFGEPVVVIDIETDPRWQDFKSLVLPLGFKACWSSPIKSGERVIGTFAFYYRDHRGPKAVERDLVEACVHLCTIAIDREERVMERQRLTYSDAMTGLSNRAHFNQLLAEELPRSRRAWGILLVDIDNLKLVNDTFGHAAGDALIQVVADRISATAGAKNTFRLGGDEFAVIVSDDNLDLSARASAILKALSSPSTCDGHVVFPAATIGGALAETETNPDQTRQNADVALYHAKEHNRGRYVQHYPGLGTALTRRFRAVRDVGVALEDDRIDAHYQPILRLDTREIVGFEALCRMTTPSGEIIAAAHFHEATKDAHIAAELTQRMLVRVARDIRSWLARGLPLQHVGINLSAADFRGGNLQDRLCRIFGEAEVPLKHIILEVTESVYLGQRDYVIADEIKALRSKGLRVALDDFGTGYASLTHLLTVPVDIIKIDKSFIDRMVPGDAGTFIVEGLIGIAHKLGIRVVAEGIETEPQAAQLSQLGCKLGQGYLFSKAVDRTVAAAILEQHGQRLNQDKTRAGAL
ncbi:EAL domain-containing protein [Rhizobium laguerreae]|uniref:putative bifunctional diguanylate cyclase/phosphodiesterase n=1 Tax=Rhizobium TaxID=379 RepID=UPI001C90F32C|nr:MULTISPECIES: EAL domain-containing protein [Rhizobium]MBY3034676.1 EAL domain-containing protein [Rhizobium laguerreae]MBY3216585.1 EAL domain-containing protein [Rhizobium laguerreae]MBY3333225.1 EAL domain-containing protein [Rhizobium laguerreae]MBY5757500.1 EAL domain-containing protein [Rhizobium leguminosarum]